MASQLLHHYYHHRHITVPSLHSHRNTFFSPMQKNDRKNYLKLVSGPKIERFMGIKAHLNSSSDSSFSTNEVTTPIATSDNSVSSEHMLHSSNTKSLIMDERFITAPHKSTYKATVTAKFDQNQLGLFNIMKAKLLLEIVAAELDPRSGSEKGRIKKEAQGVRHDKEVKFEATFEIPLEFGEIGAVIVTNEHNKEIYIYNITIDHLRKGTITIPCNSWIHSKHDNPTDDRIFFTNKSYLPSQTPSGLKKLRAKELNTLRGNGDGERKAFERIYDYDVYNDLGNPDDTTTDLSRPTLGGMKYAYPRRCRTGRPRCNKDPLSESRSDNFVYVPSDEAFSDVKSNSFGKNKVSSFIRALFLPLVESALTDKEFTYFTKIDTLFAEGINVKVNTDLDLLTLLPTIIKAVTDAGECVLRFNVPQLMDRDRFSWLRDEEFCRQTVAGINPCTIQLVKEWPLRSSLDPKVYGPPESAITKQMVEQQINGVMTLEEAIKQKKLFIIDYHDILLPYVNKVSELEGRTLYGSRTLMFLKPTDELMPIAIELTRPPVNNKPQWKQVFVPSSDATNSWLWKLAKTHVLAHDSGVHQLVSHWLRTHCATEPYIIASNRQLSAMHPIYRLLHPHFRYTMEINAEARKSLINAGGIIELGFSPAKYSMELSSVAYDQWRFDLQGLPADLISRGMAIEDPSAPHGLKLAIEDYPYASDGLILWDAIEEWVASYVDHYYPDQTLVEQDQELQAWWTEIRTVGHGDKKDEPWWPILKTPKDLIKILTTIIWVASGHHSAVNFGQYDYAGYFPNRPAIARTKMPTEDSSHDEWKRFVEKPEQALLACLPSVTQATIVMAILSVLSDHASDEEYIGQHIEPSWELDPIVESSFRMFSARLMMLKATIDRRNADKSLMNRSGVGLVPYEFFIPVSEEAGVTGKGVPNSISI